ncbi:hypothetical protein BD626DRAFT_376617, partial [Schizophyllum amplum]
TSISLARLASCKRAITSTNSATCPSRGVPHGTPSTLPISSPLLLLAPPPASLINATLTISASLVQNSGTKRAMPRSTEKWWATASSREAAAQAKRGLKNTCGYVRARRSRSDVRAALVSGGGSSTRRWGHGTGTKQMASGLRVASGMARITAPNTASTRVPSTNARNSLSAYHDPTSSAAHCISSRLPLTHNNSNAIRTIFPRASDASVSDSLSISPTTRR